ncbi:MAG: hypothetical protein NDF54_07090 [archaeon GB-1867-035]|nr:hypothetical protein [Candidatus Culexmicrobium profundum]
MQKYTKNELMDIMRKQDRKKVSIKELLFILKDNVISTFLDEIDLIQRKLRQLEERIELLEIKYEKKKIEEKMFFRRIPKNEAKSLIKEYISKNPGCLTSEIIEDLRLAPELVIKILQELEREGEIEARKIE